MGWSPSITRADYFWSKVQKRGENDCWLWQGALDKEGYGRHEWKQKKYGAHRVAKALSMGMEPAELDGNLDVGHSCEVRMCCNPKHLIEQTNLENIAQRDANGKTAVGEQNGRAKLLIEQVIEIRAKRSDGQSYRSLAREYGLDKTSIRALCTGRSWKSVPMEAS